MATLTKTSTPGIYRRHVKGCPNVNGKGRCNCNYAVPRRHRGRQRMETYRTFDEARTAKGRQDSGDTKPKSKIKFGTYFADWIETYAGRTKRGFEEETRTEYRRSIESDALPLWLDLLMAEIDQAEVRRLYKSMLDNGKLHAAMKKTRGALSPLFNTAIEERVIDFNPVTGVKIPAPTKTLAEDEDEERGKALKRTELAAFLNAVDPEWRLFFEFLTVTGLRIGEAIGLLWKNAVLTGDQPRIRVREQIYKGRRKKYLKSDEGKRDIPLTPAWVGRLTAHRSDNCIRDFFTFEFFFSDFVHLFSPTITSARKRHLLRVDTPGKQVDCGGRCSAGVAGKAFLELVAELSSLYPHLVKLCHCAPPVELVLRWNHSRIPAVTVGPFLLRHSGASASGEGFDAGLLRPQSVASPARC